MVLLMVKAMENELQNNGKKEEIAKDEKQGNNLFQLLGWQRE